jgi:hypothetical protein
LALLYIQTKEKERKVVWRGGVWADDEGEQLCAYSEYVRVCVSWVNYKYCKSWKKRTVSAWISFEASKP